MQHKPRTVLHVNSVDETASYRAAVAQIIRNVEHDFSLTLHEISDSIDVSLGTISNAANKKSDLSSVYLARIGKLYGAEYLDPYHRLYGGRCASVEAGYADPLPAMTALIAKIATARSAGLPENHQQLLDMLPELRAAAVSVNAMIVKAEGFKA